MTASVCLFSLKKLNNINLKGRRRGTNLSVTLPRYILKLDEAKPYAPPLQLPQLACSMISYVPTKASARLHPHRPKYRMMQQNYAARFSRLNFACRRETHEDQGAAPANRPHMLCASAIRHSATFIRTPSDTRFITL